MTHLHIWKRFVLYGTWLWDGHVGHGPSQPYYVGWRCRCGEYGYGVPR